MLPIKGYLFDSHNKPVEGAVIMIIDGPEEFTDIASISNENGEFSLSNISGAGVYVLQIQLNGRAIKKKLLLSNNAKDVRILFPVD